MKKIFVLLLALASAGIINNASAQCTPQDPSGNPGLNPNWACLPCAVQGSEYYAIIAVENFDSVGPVVIQSLRVDSLTNLPSGLTYEMNPSNNTLPGGGTGCIAVSGTTNDTVGNYKLGIYVTVTLSIGQFNGEAGQIVQNLITAGILDTNTTAVPNFDYFARVVADENDCVRDDSCGFPIGIKSLDKYMSNLTAQPNPFSSVSQVTWNSSVDGMYTAKLIDMTGKEVINQQIHVRIGDNKFAVEKKEDMPSGSYIFMLTDGRKTMTTKLMVRE